MKEYKLNTLYRLKYIEPTSYHDNRLPEYVYTTSAQVAPGMVLIRESRHYMFRHWSYIYRPELERVTSISKQCQKLIDQILIDRFIYNL